MDASVKTSYALHGHPPRFVFQYQPFGATEWVNVELAGKNLETVVPSISAVRITLQNAGCIVEDLYLSPRPQGCKISLDPKKGTLTTWVQLDRVGHEAVTEEGALLEVQEKDVAFLRKLFIRPIEK